MSTNYHLRVPDGARQRLLDAIKARKGDEEVISLLRELAKSNATANAARSPALPGRWNLLWASSNAEACFPMEHVLGKKMVRVQRVCLPGFANDAYCRKCCGPA